MALYAIGDLHLSLGANKPMDVFRGWENYIEKLQDNWQKTICPEDTVVLAGDTSWAMKLEDCAADFAFIQALPGRKLLLKGNHDYWWATRQKMDAYLAENGFNTLHILHNNAYEAQGVALCGTRGWMPEPGSPPDAKVMAREAGRLKASLQAAETRYPALEKLVFLHFPPIYPGAVFEAVVQTLHQYGVRQCCYGHLHGQRARRAAEGVQNGIRYRLISADALDFMPLRLRE